MEKSGNNYDPYSRNEQIEREVDAVWDRVMDPELAGLIGGAAQYWVSMAPHAKNERDVGGVIDTINGVVANFFSPYGDRGAQVTGYLREVNVGADPSVTSLVEGGGEGAAEKFRCDWIGFTALKQESRYELGFLFADIDTNINREGHINETFYTAPCNALIELSGVFSERHINDILYGYVPNLLTEIDERLIRADSSSEALSLLGGVDYSDLNNLAKEDPANFDKVSTALNYYLSNASDLDNALPYSVECKGDGFVINEDGRRSLVDLRGKNINMTIQGFSHNALDVGGGDIVCVPAIAGVVHGKENNGSDSTFVEIPLRFINKATSFREQFNSANE